MRSGLAFFVSARFSLPQIATDLDQGGKVGDSEYVIIYSPAEALKVTRDSDLKGVIIFGGNGGCEFLLHDKKRGYGLHPAISSWPENFIPLGETLEMVFAKAEKGQWFS